jgi:hypothetical protein
VEIPENSENHLKAIVDWRQAAEGDGLDKRRNVGTKTAGRREGVENRDRDWQSSLRSANYIDLRESGRASVMSPCPSISLIDLRTGF